MRRGRRWPAGHGSAGLLGAALFLSAGAILDSGAVAAPAHPAAPRADTPVPFALALEQAIDRIAAERHRDAVGPLGAALAQDRNDPLGMLTLAALRLHGDDARGAGYAARRAVASDPRDRVAALAALSVQVAAADPDALRNARRLVDAGIAEARPFVLYGELLAGDAAGVALALRAVEADEPDALLLELAGIASLRAGDVARGERLLHAFLARPEGSGLAEPVGPVLTFLPDHPVEGTATTRGEDIVFPPPVPGVLRDTAVLTPGALPRGVAMVSYEIDQSVRMMTNSAPFHADWDTRRVPNGEHTLTVEAYDAASRLIATRTVTLRVLNPTPTRRPGDRVDPERRELLRERIRDLFVPFPSRKAAHYELALSAAKRGDTATALRAIENVCAIDPFYRDASGSLRRFNTRYVTPGVGYWQGRTTEKIVALTFDDGPNPERTPALLDVLRNHAVPSTFFVVGTRAAAAPGLLKRMDDEGHEIANHSHTHPNLTFLPPADIWRELCRATVVVRDAVGKRPRFYRPPGGNFNGETAQAAAALGMDGAYWTIDAFKFERPPFKPAQLVEYVVSRARPGAILLMHNAPDNTVAAVPEIVRRLREQGYTFVTMSELTRRCRDAAPPDRAAPGRAPADATPPPARQKRTRPALRLSSPVRKP